MTITALIKVWVMALSGGIVVWNPSLWYVEDELVPIRSNKTTGSAGACSFRLLRRSRKDSASTTIASSFSPQRGQYCAITTWACTLPGNTGTLWAGVLDGKSTRPLKGSSDRIGSITAHELSAVLDQVPVSGLRMRDPAGVIANGIPLLTNPDANLAGQTQGEVIGNGILAPVAVQNADGTRLQFASLPEDCGTAAADYFSRWLLLDHVLYWTYTEGLPLISINASVALKAHLSETVKEVISLKGNLTIKGLLDLLAGQARGLYWTADFEAGAGIRIDLWSGLDAAVGTIPAATATAVTLANDEDLVLGESGVDLYDAVEVVGNPIVFCGTISHIDSTMDFGWSAAEETAYLVGASAGTGYAGLTDDAEKIERNRLVRKSGRLADVYVRYIHKVSSSQEFLCKAAAGVPAGTTQYFYPSIDWNGTTATIDDMTSRGPYAPSARLMRQLPWPNGKSAGGTDDRTDEQKARPAYMSPLVLSYRVAGASADWSNLCHPPSSTWGTPRVSIDSRGPALRVEYEQPEMLADGRFSGAALSEFDPSYVTSYGASDPAKLVLTVAGESDQRVLVRKYRSGYDASSARNILRINRADIHCWVVRKYTALGLDVNGALDETATDVFVRNDWAVAEKIANEAAAFAFRPRTGARITLVTPHNPPGWCSTLGVLISTLTDGAQVNTLNTYLSNIDQEWDPAKPRLALTTSDPIFPDSTAMAPLVPSLGGTVSNALGTTLPAMVQAIDGHVRELQKAQESVPIHTQQMGIPPSATADIYVRIRWSFTVSAGHLVDGSEGEIVDSSGAALSSKLVWIESKTSLGNVRPSLFGAVYYLCEDAGSNVTRGGVTRALYRAKSFAGYYGTTDQGFEARIVAGVGKIYNDVLSAIQTTIGGAAAADNTLPMYGVIVDGFAYDCGICNWYYGWATKWPALQPDVFCLGRGRQGYVTGYALMTIAGSSTIALTTSIDPYEAFTLKIFINSGIGGSAIDSKVSVGYVEANSKNPGSGTPTISGIQTSLDHEVAQAGNDFSASYNLLVTGWVYTLTITGPAYPTITVTFTYTAGRITTITLTCTAGAYYVSAAVVGGRPSWTNP